MISEFCADKHARPDEKQTKDNGAQNVSASVEVISRAQHFQRLRRESGVGGEAAAKSDGEHEFPVAAGANRHEKTEEERPNAVDA